MMNSRTFLLAAMAALTTAPVIAQRSPNAFKAPQASWQYAPSRTCDLLNVNVDLDVDYAKRAFTGTSVNKMQVLRSGTNEVSIMAGPALTILSVTLDGQPAGFRRDGNRLIVATPGVKKGQIIEIATKYTQANAKGVGFGQGGGGWHWIEPTPDKPQRTGFWTQGETGYNSQWAPTWDYPNDMATSRVRCTVPAAWECIGNGVLTSSKVKGDRKTVEWTMTQPHATYLLSLVGGPLDVKKDKWEGVDLWYVVPQGKANLIEGSYGHTKDMLSYFSEVTGVKYPWPKYAQSSMYDFGGGMENVSATTLGQDSLTEEREGFYNMDSLNSHELAHQWFGDLVTCMHWGDTWLNESFATYFEMLYMRHSRGENEYLTEVAGNTRSYLAEARRYLRPISTKFYSNPDVMFDSHTYPKGGVVLHTLRRQIGDEAFFAGINYYLTKWRHTPVESAQLRRAFLEATGINVEPFWAQWFEKPGHPVLEPRWTALGDTVQLTIKQVQNTSEGVPVYDIPASVGIIGKDGSKTIVPIHLSQTEETFNLAAPHGAAAVLVDPNWDFLREVVNVKWTLSEAEAVMEYGWAAPDRNEAFIQVVAEGGSVEKCLHALAGDMSADPAIRGVGRILGKVEESQRGFWMTQAGHPNMDRREVAYSALAKLPATPEATKLMREAINDKTSIDIVVTAIRALAAWDAAGNKSLFEKATQITDMRGRIKRAAETALGKS